MQTHGASLRRRVSNGIAMADGFRMLLLRIGAAFRPKDPAWSSFVVTWVAIKRQARQLLRCLFGLIYIATTCHGP